MTYGELFAALGELLNNRTVADVEDVEVIVRATDADDNMVIADLKRISLEFGCADALALMLDADQEPEAEVTP